MSEIMTKTRSGSAGNLDHVDHFWQHGYAVVRGLFFKSEMGEMQVESRRVYELTKQLRGDGALARAGHHSCTKSRALSAATTSGMRSAASG